MSDPSAPFVLDTSRSGTCCDTIRVWLRGGIIERVEFSRGCSGNHKGIAALVQGRPAEEVIRLLKGTLCGGRGTSCPDQLAKALEAALGQGRKSHA
jgi:uncharacterized protein (TIGR03905 family)